ncbi:hypothetical protein OH492_23310 [Vibrio chagasii]|nr:hypothetical protein [Vibrio chagasii]
MLKRKALHRLPVILVNSNRDHHDLRLLMQLIDPYQWEVVRNIMRKESQIRIFYLQWWPNST